jgi:hypothetical protein
LDLLPFWLPHGNINQFMAAEVKLNYSFLGNGLLKIYRQLKFLTPHIFHFPDKMRGFVIR